MVWQYGSMARHVKLQVVDKQSSPVRTTAGGCYAAGPKCICWQCSTVQHPAVCGVTLPVLLQRHHREALQDHHSHLAGALVNFSWGIREVLLQLAAGGT